MPRLIRSRWLNASTGPSSAGVTSTVLPSISCSSRTAWPARLREGGRCDHPVGVEGHTWPATTSMSGGKTSGGRRFLNSRICSDAPVLSAGLDRGIAEGGEPHNSAVRMVRHAPSEYQLDAQWGALMVLPLFATVLTNGRRRPVARSASASACSMRSSITWADRRRSSTATTMQPSMPASWPSRLSSMASAWGGRHGVDRW